MGSAARLAGMDGRCNTTDGRVVAYNTWWRVAMERTWSWTPCSGCHDAQRLTILPYSLGFRRKETMGSVTSPHWVQERSVLPLTWHISLLYKRGHAFFFLSYMIHRMDPTSSSCLRTNVAHSVIDSSKPVLMFFEIYTTRETPAAVEPVLMLPWTGSKEKSIRACTDLLSTKMGNKKG
jgi:hypothetical protein